MKRNIIKIDEEKCNGCGICVTACHEGALQIIDGKARLVSESYCDGLGACLPECPMDAIHLEERDADEFDEEAVKERMAEMEKAKVPAKAEGCGCGGGVSHHIAHDHGAHTSGGHARGGHQGGGCPGSMARALVRPVTATTAASVAASAPTVSVPAQAPAQDAGTSQLGQWPCQIKLVPVNAPYFAGADLLIAADCTAYAYANVHRDFMKGRITLIGCPKLDEGDYADKLTAILAQNDIKSVTVLRMSVPCCGGIVNAVKQALMKSGNLIPWSVTTISPDGQIIA